MSVLIWVYHELCPTLNSLLQLSIADLVEDRMDDLIDAAIISNSYYGFNHLMLDHLGIQVNRHVSSVLMENGPFSTTSLNYYSVYDLLYEAHLRILLLFLL